MATPPSLAQAPAPSIRWCESVDLGYAQDKTDTPSAAPKNTETVLCFFCGKHPDKVLRCSKCRVACYCQKECQVADWKQSHKRACASYHRVGPTKTLTADAQADVKVEIYGKIRLYANAYAVFQCDKLGRGFLFMQSSSTLVTMSLGAPKDIDGRPTPTRSVLLHYLTMGEFTSEVCRDDFELATVQRSLQQAVDEYDPDREVVLLMRFRCGNLSVGITPMIPDVGVCRKLGKDYFADMDSEALQLNID